MSETQLHFPQHEQAHSSSLCSHIPRQNVSSKTNPASIVQQQCDKPPFSRQEKPTSTQVAPSLHKKQLNNVACEHFTKQGMGQAPGLSTSECGLSRKFFFMNEEILTKRSRTGDSLRTPCSCCRHFCSSRCWCRGLAALSSLTCFFMRLRWVVELFRGCPAPNTRLCSSLFVHGGLTRAFRLDLSRLFVATHVRCLARVFSRWFALLSTNRWTTSAA